MTAAQDAGLGEVGYGRSVRLEGLGSRVLRALLRWDARHRERAQLAALDEAALRDMGISPGQAEAEASRPIWRA